ncbi:MULTISPECIES: ExeA family protein [Bacillati]|uniref:ExeA family protein n=1 Tax=Bacillati TaxID=1783272 RepID=UPI00191565DE|nr:MULTISPECIES: AAA family ATPase [Terrabacteria group]MCL6543463.1 AAA family ATPase [Roseiflexus sp.]
MNAAVLPSQTPKPFSKELDPSLCYEFRGHREASARLDLMIQHRTLGVLTGEVGGGKSTLIRRLFTSLDPMTYLPIYLCYASLKPREFYGGLLEAVGVEPVYTVSRARKLWQEVVRSRSAPGERTMVVVIDEAHEMSEAMLLELRFALNYNIDSASLFPLILVGQPELRKLLRLKKYEATVQRIGMQYHLSGMSKEETSAYIRHHMTVSRTEKPVFAESALSRIFAASQGLPRVVNQICTQILLDAAARNLDVIEEGDVVRVLADMDRQRGVTS